MTAPASWICWTIICTGFIRNSTRRHPYQTSPQTSYRQIYPWTVDRVPLCRRGVLVASIYLQTISLRFADRYRYTKRSWIRGWLGLPLFVVGTRRNRRCWHLRGHSRTRRRRINPWNSHLFLNGCFGSFRRVALCEANRAG